MPYDAAPPRYVPRRGGPQAVRGTHARRQRTSARLSSLVMLLGALLLVLGGGTVAYAQWSEWQHSRQANVEPREALPARLANDPPAAPAAPANPPAAAGPRLATWAPAGVPVRVDIPRINVNSRVMEMTARDGEYQVPSFDVGYHADSALVGEVGNAVFNGHLETIDAGKVFARLHELTAGDAVYVYTATHRFDWVVQEVRTVANTERSFIQPTADARITLYTCAGSYDPRTRDYTHRLVVVAKLVQASART